MNVETDEGAKDNSFVMKTNEQLRQNETTEKPLNLEDLKLQMESEDRSYVGNSGLNSDEASAITKMISSVEFRKENPNIAGMDIAQVSKDPSLRGYVELFKSLDKLVAVGALKPEDNEVNLTRADREKLFKRGMDNFAKLRGDIKKEFGGFLSKDGSFEKNTSELLQAKDFVKTETDDINVWSLVKDLAESGVVDLSTQNAYAGSDSKKIFDNLKTQPALISDPNLRSFIEKAQTAQKALRRGHIKTRAQYISTLGQLKKELLKL
jgi:hypothetical protein